MLKRKNCGPLVMFSVLMLLTSCGAKSNLANGSYPPVSKESLPVTSPSTAPVSSLVVEEISTAKEDDSIRAIGLHPDGRLLVKPVSKAKVAALGAPSCIGLETDLIWSGEYEAVWESKADGISSKLMPFSIDFGIVQPNEAPVQMQQFTLGDTTIFAYVPRYTDCHGLETYFFGVREGKAFPIAIEIKPEQIWMNISQLPHRPFQVTKGELILTGGYGAGQDYINVYHFHYDPKKRSFILQHTDQVAPNDIVYDQKGDGR